MEERIRKVLKEKVDPVLAAHYGGAILTDYRDGVAMVRLVVMPVDNPTVPNALVISKIASIRVISGSIKTIRYVPIKITPTAIRAITDAFLKASLGTE